MSDIIITLKLNDAQAGAVINAINKRFWKLVKKSDITPGEEQELKALNEVLIMFNIRMCDMLSADRKEKS